MDIFFNQLIQFYHRLRGSAMQPCVNSDWLCQWERAIFDPHRIHTPWQITKKIIASDYVCDPLRLCQIWCKSLRGGLLRKWVKYNELYLFIYTFFHELTYICLSLGLLFLHLTTNEDSSKTKHHSDSRNIFLAAWLPSFRALSSYFLFLFVCICLFLNSNVNDYSFQ